MLFAAMVQISLILIVQILTRAFKNKTMSDDAKRDWWYTFLQECVACAGICFFAFQFYKHQNSRFWSKYMTYSLAVLMIYPLTFAVYEMCVRIFELYGKDESGKWLLITLSVLCLVVSIVNFCCFMKPYKKVITEQEVKSMY